MANSNLPLLLLLSVLALSSTAYSGSSRPDFIISSCGVTRYRSLCAKSLSIFADKIQTSSREMALVSLFLSLSRANYTKTYVIEMGKSKGLKPKEYQVMIDCVENMASCVDKLSDSVYELGHTSQGEKESFIWHMSNVQTWVSAALTDETTCIDGFAGRAMDGKLKYGMKNRVKHLARVTSNALALVNLFVDRQLAT